MVLEEVGGRIRRAVEQMKNATIIDDKVLNDCLNEITRALLLSDVQFKLVHDMITNMRKYLNTLSVAHYRNFTTIQHSIFVELCKMLYNGNQSFTPMKGEPSVVMFVGLQGSGKTTTCTKYARYHKMRGWKPALVCAADTFSSHQLKLNATEANIPFYGSDDVGSDPVKVAVKGVKMFEKQNRDLIIVDTSIRVAGDNQQVEKLRKLYMKTKPDLLVFVMDSSVGQEAALHQAQAFRRNTLYAVGAVILTKLDAHAKGAGALSAVAAAGSPVIFIGTGEHMDDFQAFVGRPFVGRLLGTGDLYQVVQRKTHPGETFTFRIMYEQFQNILKIAPIDQVVSSMAPPGFRSELMPKGDQKIRKAKIKTYMSMMKAMTNEELDSKDPEYFIDEVKMMRIARGAGCELSEVIDMFEEYKRLARVWSKLKSYEKFIDEDGKMYIRSCRGWPLTKTEWVLVMPEAP